MTIRKIAISLQFVSVFAQAAVIVDYGEFGISSRLECTATSEYLDDYSNFPASPSFSYVTSAADPEFCSGGANADASADVTISPNLYSFDLLVSGDTSGGATTSTYATVSGLDRIHFSLAESSTVNISGTVDFALMSLVNGEPADASGYFYFKVYSNEDYFYEAASSAPKNTGTWDWIFNDQLVLPPGAYVLEAGISTFSRLPGSTHSGVMDMTLTINPLIPVGINIKPWDSTNVVDPTGTSSGHRRTRVAILTDGSFDATQVAPDTVRFGSLQAPNVKNPPKVVNVDGDGDDDFIVAFVTDATGIACGDTSVTLEGETYAGDAFIGTDTIDTTEPCISACHP